MFYLYNFAILEPIFVSFIVIIRFWDYQILKRFIFMNKNDSINSNPSEIKIDIKTHFYVFCNSYYVLFKSVFLNKYLTNQTQYKDILWVLS